MSERSIKDLTLAMRPNGKHVVLNVHYGEMGAISEAVVLTGEDAAQLAAWLLMLGGLTGSTDASVSILAERLREKFDDLLDAIRILTPEEATDEQDACPVCGRVIHHSSNMRRHIEAKHRAASVEVAS